MKYGANESSLSGGELCVLAGMVDEGLEPLESSADRGVAGWRVGGDVGENRSQEPGIGTGEEQGDPKASGCKSVAVAARNPFDDAVEAQSAKIAGHAASGAGGWSRPGICASSTRNSALVNPCSWRLKTAGTAKRA